MQEILQPDSKKTCDSFEQPLKQSASTVKTEEGIQMDSSAVQCQNARDSKRVILQPSSNPIDESCVCAVK
jgi:hypothetical protein